MVRKMLRLIAVAMVVCSVFGCKKNSQKQVMDHVPLSYSEVQSVLDMEVPDDGPIQQEKLISRNEVSYYTLTSISGIDLYSEISQKGPSSISCEGCAWAYSWDFLWKWDTRDVSGVCSVNWINSKVYFSYHLPLWVREKEAPILFRQRYSEWMCGVWLSVNRRTLVVLQEIALLERNVMSFPKERCADLDRRIKTEGALTMANINSKIGALPPGESREWMRDY